MDFQGNNFNQSKTKQKTKTTKKIGLERGEGERPSKNIWLNLTKTIFYFKQNESVVNALQHLVSTL